MRSKSFAGTACSIAAVPDAVGDRWAVLILCDLSVDKGHCLTCFWRLDI